MPLVGAYVADKYFGRLRTIQYAIKFALIGHCILVISAMPFIIAMPDVSLAVFTIGLVVMGM
jgi:POT family proton-dependent oligopeptide transporter